MTDVRFRYLKNDINRHGKARFYVRVPGKRMIRLQVDRKDDPEFSLAYAAALNGETWTPKSKTAPPAPADRPIQGSLRALCVRYCAYLAEDKQLSEGTKYTRRKHLEDICREPPSPGSAKVLGDIPLGRFDSSHILAIMDRKRAQPEASNGRRKAINALFNWAIPRKLATSNPALTVKKLKANGDGYRTWKMQEVERFAKVHPLGTRAHLAMALLLFTGQRRGDVIQFGRQHIKDGAIYFVQQKGAKGSASTMRIPVIPALQSVLDLVPKTQMNFLVTGQGKPFTAAGFGNWFRDVCNEAGLTGLSAHGLRKALQAMGADIGLSDRELMAIAGHETTRMTSLYTKQRDRDLLAARGMARISEIVFEGGIGAPSDGLPESASILGKNINEINGKQKPWLPEQDSNLRPFD